jgi:hypothetical protein
MLIADDYPAGRDQGVVNLSFGIPLSVESDEVMGVIWCKLLSMQTNVAFDER